MSELLLVNPRKRRTAAQKRATAKLVASNRKRRSAPKRRRRSVAASAGAAVRTVRRRYHSVARSVRRRARSRTTRATMGGIMGTVKHGLIGGAGAVAVDVIASKIPLPASLQSGIGGAAAKVGIAIATGMLLGKVINKSTAHEMAAGSITVTSYQLIRGLVGGFVGLNGITDINGMGGVGFYSPALTVDGADSMGQYMSGMGELDYDYSGADGYSYM